MSYRARVFLPLILLISLPSLAGEWVYTVSKGDNLWNLSHSYLKQGLQWKAIQRINQIQNPHHIEPGTTIKIPLEWLKVLPVPAHLVTFRGTVFVVRSGSKAVDYAKKDMLVYMGDRLETKEDSSALIKLADDSELLLKADVVVVFDLLHAYGDTGMVDSRLRLLSGDMESSVRKSIGPGSRFEIEAPSVVAAVRGTRFRQKYNQHSGVSSIEVLGGEVVAQQEDIAVSVPKGFGILASQDQLLTAPVALLPAPEWLIPPAASEHPGTLVQWQPIKGATRYIITIFATETMGLVKELSSVINEIVLPDLPSGKYRIEVSATDRLDLQGNALTAGFSLTPAPVIFIPAISSEWWEDGINITWTAEQAHSVFEIQFAKDPHFESIYHRQFVSNRNYLMPHRSESYYVRVRSAAYDPQQQVWSESRFIEEQRTAGKVLFGWASALIFFLGL